jgi:hypothetical protein
VTNRNLKFLAVILAFFFGVVLTATTKRLTDRPTEIFFDVYSTTPEAPAPPLFHHRVSLRLEEGRTVSAYVRGEHRFSFIVCRPDGDVNPCGPDGVAPDERGTVVVPGAEERCAVE